MFFLLVPICFLSFLYFLFADSMDLNSNKTSSRKASNYALSETDIKDIDHDDIEAGNGGGKICITFAECNVDIVDISKVFLSYYIYFFKYLYSSYPYSVKKKGNVKRKKET